MKKWLVFVGSFIIALLVFLPKENIFYTLQNRASEKNMSFNYDKVKENPLLLSLEGGTAFYEELPLASFRTLEVHSYGVMNTLVAEKITLTPDFSELFPEVIESVIVKQRLWRPDNIVIEMSGDFGVAKGEYSLFHRRLHLVIEPSRILFRFPALMNKLKKNENGEWVYEYFY